MKLLLRLGMSNTITLKDFITILLFSCVYIILGIISTTCTSMPSGISITWLPNSIVLAYFLTHRISLWKYSVLFFLFAEIIADYSSFTLIQSIQFGLINIFETTFAAYFIKKFTQKNQTNFTNTQYVVIFIIFGLTIMPALAAIFGAMVYFTQIGTASSYLELWRIWFFGDSIGILLLTPLFVFLIEDYQSLKNYKLTLQNFLILALTLYFAYTLFSMNMPLLNLPTTPIIFILILLWIVYKQGLIPGLIVAFTVSCIATYFTTQEIGPFWVFELTQNVIYLQEFIAAMLTITLFFGVLHKEIIDSKIQLKKLNATLEQKVEEKTKSLLEANEKLALLASKDALTNLYNRRSIDQYMLQETNQCNRYSSTLSMIIIDIDHFKNINDTFGHQIGDEVLVTLANTISSHIREADIFGRWGGEEFIILLPQTTLQKATLVANQLKNTIEKQSFTPINNLTISLGVTQYIQNEEINSFIKRADDALYQAKQTGRNKVVTL